jgi:hypothetical protein
MLLGQFARVGQCVDRIEISGYQTFIERSKSRRAACITNGDQSSLFALHRAIFRHSARTISHRHTRPTRYDPERFRRGGGLLLAGNDWRSILSGCAQWVRYP